MPLPAQRRPTRCLLLSYVFPPSTGGIETVSQLLATLLADAGYEVRVVTQTAASPGADDDDERRPYRVFRGLREFGLLRQLRWADLILQSNLSLKLAWPLACGLVRRPWVLVHHTPLSRPSGALTIRDRIKRLAIRGARNYAVSRFLASTVAARCEVLYNPYDDGLFHTTEAGVRDQQLMFLGRLVPAKGVDVLIHALAKLAEDRIRPGLTVVGSGPCESELRALAVSLGVHAQVSFVGAKSGAELAALLARHQVVVVPSRAAPPEALGLVSLEAIACGCVVIAAAQGGLPESIGPCGLTFEPESPSDLAAVIRRVLESEALRLKLAVGRTAFLSEFGRERVLQRYRVAIEAALGGDTPQPNKTRPAA